MEINLFNDPNLVPQPKDRVYIEDLIATPYPDRFRVKVGLKITPFQERPNLVIVAHRNDGKQVSDLDIIATMHYDNEYTLHIRGIDDPQGDYMLTAELYYDSRNPPQDKKQTPFSIPAEDA